MEINHPNQMSVLEAIKTRRSIRKFQNQEIPSEIVEKLIEALIWAPSAGNLQSRKFYFIFNAKIKEKLAEAALGQDFIAQAPLVIVGCSDDKIKWKYGERGKKIYALCDVAMSIQNMMILAKDLKLGSCPVGAFLEDQVSEILKIPKNLHPILIVPVGYPAEKPIPPPRISQTEATEFIK